MARLELVSVNLFVHGRPLFGPLSAQVQAGEVLAVMGASGCGKSSLLAWMAGLLQAPLSATGGLLLNGRSLQGVATEARGVGLLFQDDLLFPNLTVMGNLLFALPAGGSAAERRQQAEQALEQAGLAGFGPRRPASLSGGQRSRISLLRALLAKPEVLLLDEPFSKLDADLRAQMREFSFSTLRKAGVAAVLVTHDEQDIPPQAQLYRVPNPHA
jgi:putative thiamine transport system ATP-binding protein